MNGAMSLFELLNGAFVLVNGVQFEKTSSPVQYFALAQQGFIQLSVRAGYPLS